MNLTELFSGIANSIRNKDGTTEPINATDFPSRIESIPSGKTHFGDDFPLLDGNTHIWVKRELEEQYDTFIFKFDLVDGEITFNWGDGTSDTVTTAGYQEISHIYDIGEYRLDIVASGEWGIGNKTTATAPETRSRLFTKFVEFGNGIKRIGNQSFQGMARLQEIAFNLGEDNICYLYSNVFQNIYSLQKYTVYSGTLKQYSTNGALFQNDYSLLEVDFSNFDYTSLNSMCYQCYGLVNVKGLEGVTSLGGNAFGNCVCLTEITLPSSITSISATAFNGCTRLADIYVPWGEDEVANSPWGATNAQIHFNYKESEE